MALMDGYSPTMDDYLLLQSSIGLIGERSKEKPSVKRAEEVTRWISEKIRYGGVSVHGVPLMFSRTIDTYLGSGKVSLVAHDMNVVDLPVKNWPLKAEDVQPMPDSFEHREEAHRLLKLMNEVVRLSRPGISLLPADVPLQFMVVRDYVCVVLKLYKDLSWIDEGWGGPLITVRIGTIDTKSTDDTVGYIPSSQRLYTPEDVIRPFHDFIEHKIPTDTGSLTVFDDFRTVYGQLYNLLFNRTWEDAVCSQTDWQQFKPTHWLDQ